MSATLGTASLGSLVDSSGARLVDSFGATLVELPSGPIYDARTALFFCAEVDAYDPVSFVTDVIRVSDLGYRTRAGDPFGATPYPALLDQAFELDRRVGLDPSQTSTTAFGAVRIINLRQRFDDLYDTRNNDGRVVRLLIGQKRYDPSRGIHVDPPYGDLTPFFVGAGAAWQLAEDFLTITLRDPSYTADKVLQRRHYGGTGGLDGTPDLAGKAMPVTRGGTAAYPVLNVPLKLVDPVANIWQWTDGLGTAVAVYEGGSPVFTAAGDVLDLYQGMTPPGAYRTCGAKGLLQLGSMPVRAITADVTGTVAGLAVPTAAGLAREVLLQDLGFFVGLMDGGSFAAADLAYPWLAGFHAADTVRGLDVVQRLLGSIGGRLLARRDGALGVFVLASGGQGASGVSLDRSNVVSVTPQPLPTALDPPPHRWQIGWGTNNLVQLSDFNGDLTPERKQFLAAATRYATWTGPAVERAWIKPGEPAALDTDLLVQADAQTLADRLGELWQDRPGLYTVVLPLDVAAGLDIGSVVSLTWPLGRLGAGAMVQIVGEQARSYDATVTFEVLTQRSAGDFSPADFGADIYGGSG